MKTCARQPAVAYRRFRMVDMLRAPTWVLVLLLLLLGRVFSSFGQTETSGWLYRASTLQRYLMYDVPMNQQTLTATHNSFSSDMNSSTHSKFEVLTAQNFSMTDQLSCLGVRGLELDLHYIEELAKEGDEDSAIRICHTSAEVAMQVSQLCEAFGWDICEEAGAPNFGNDTGCRRDAPTLREGFQEIATWVSGSKNENEVVFIKLDSSLDGQEDRVSTIAADVFGEEIIFSPPKWEEYSGSEDWPTPAELVENGTRVILAGPEPSSLVFSSINDTKEEIVAAENFVANRCDEDFEDFPHVSWTRVQSDMVAYSLKRGNSTIFSYAPDDSAALTAVRALRVMLCGMTPTFDRLDADLMEGTIWSWNSARPEIGFPSPRAAVVSKLTVWRWTDTDTESSAGERHSFACRSKVNRNNWRVVSVFSASESDTNATTSSSYDTTSSTGFRLNSTVDSNITLTTTSSIDIESSGNGRRIRRRRRRLSTSDEDDDGDDDEGDNEDDDEGDNEDDDEGDNDDDDGDNDDDDDDDDGDNKDDDDEYEGDSGGFEGMFEEADEACASLEGDYIFGAPRTAYENYVLAYAMEAAGVESVWIDYTSPGDIADSSTCWTREGVAEYCVKSAVGNPCLDSLDVDTDIADGEVPMFQLAEWETENYTRPDFSVAKVVEQLHGWFRLSGSNQFDLDDHRYVIGVLLAAALLFISGFIVACCCLPVGHIAAGSKQHHVDGTGYFGSLCPARCKQGDFLGSGTLAVVVVFTLITIMGGAATIYGVRSVDKDIVNLWGSLDDMATDMVDAQTRVENIRDRLESVQFSFPYVVSCSGLSTLGGVQSGIKSAGDEIEDLAENRNIGSVGESIRNVNEVIDHTTSLRRGIVYSAGGFVLLLSTLYVLVGCYALGKDDGKGKAGGARMRGPILMGCLFLPLTLLVILLCWMLFGISTSAALLASDFCVSPMDSTVSVFADPEDQEVVAYYTSCNGSNVFSESLSVAYLQGTAASELLSSVNSVVFETACPDQLTITEELADDMDAILEEIDAIGDIVRCSRVNRYYVEGIEGSLCSDAPTKAWYVICGFAVVSISLFVVAVSFRLLLQQKEEGLYRVVFEKMSEGGESGSPSTDDVSLDAGKGNNKGRFRGTWTTASGDLVFDNPKDVSDFESQVNPMVSTVPPRAAAAAAAGRNDVDKSKAKKTRVAPGVSPAPSRAHERLRRQSSFSRTWLRLSRPGVGRVGAKSKSTVGRAKPVESSLPLPRSKSIDGGRDRDGQPQQQELKEEMQSQQQQAGELSTNPFVAVGRGGDGGGNSDTREVLPKRHFSTSHEEVSPFPRLGAVSSSARVEEERRNEGGGRASGRRDRERGLLRVDSGGGRDARHGALRTPGRLFRSLAGLDDPDEEAPTVIVSRSGGSHAGARNGLDSSEPERLTVTVARSRSFLSNRKSSEGGDDDDDGNPGVWGGLGGRASVRGRDHSGRWRPRSLARVGGNPSSSQEQYLHMLAAQPGTWAAFTREHRRDSDVEVVVTSSANFRSSGGNRRRGFGHGDGHRSPDYRRSYRVGGWDGATGSRGPITPESSTASIWKQKHMQVQEANERADWPVLVGGDGDAESIIVEEERKCVDNQREEHAGGATRGEESVQEVGEGTGEDEPGALSWRRAAYSRPQTRQLGDGYGDGGAERIKLAISDTTATTEAGAAAATSTIPAITPPKKILTLVSSSPGLDASDMCDFPSLSNPPRRVFKTKKVPTPPDSGSGLIALRPRATARVVRSTVEARREMRLKKRSRSLGKIVGKSHRAVGPPVIDGR